MVLAPLPRERLAPLGDDACRPCLVDQKVSHVLNRLDSTHTRPTTYSRLQSSSLVQQSRRIQRDMHPTSLHARIQSDARTWTSQPLLRFRNQHHTARCTPLPYPRTTARALVAHVP